MKVEYSSNNSGGRWWLSDDDWRALECAGWYVIWGGYQFCHSKYEALVPPICASEDDCHGHRKYESADAMKKKDRWLDALAKEAHKDFPSLAEAIRAWESIVKKDASDEGCTCCGPPHSFSSEHDYASGEDIVAVLYGDDVPKSLREAVERTRRVNETPENPPRRIRLNGEESA